MDNGWFTLLIVGILIAAVAVPASLLWFSVRFWKKGRLGRVAVVTLVSATCASAWLFHFRPLAEERRQAQRIKDDVVRHLYAGMEASAVGPFFAARGWQYAYDLPTGIYSASILISERVEPWFVSVHIEVKRGVIESVVARDFFRTL